MSKRLTIFLLAFLLGISISTFATLRLSANFGPSCDIPIVWDHNTPEQVSYYNIYISTTQGQFDRVFRRVTKLPTNSSPFWLKLPADGTTKYMVIRAVNDQGESPNSNQIWILPSVTSGDVE